MGLIRDLILGTPNQVINDASKGPRFAVDIDSGVLYGTPSLDDYIYRSSRISRRLALTVPAVKRARDLIAASIGQMPIRMIGPDGQATEWSLFEAPESGTAPSITWTRVAEDMLFDGRAWLRPTFIGWHGKPVEVARLDSDTVTVQPRTTTYRSRTGSGTADVWPTDDQLIRIDSPNPGILDAGGRAIRTCLAVGDSTLNVAGGLPPMTYFTPSGDIDPFDSEDDDDDEVQELLDSWQAARAKNATAYVPAALKLEALGWNPEQLQMKDLRDQAILEIARLTGADPEDLGVSTTSRTYQNQQDRRRDLLDFTIGPYLTALEGRLSLTDVTPRGYRASADTSGFLRADDKTGAETDKILIDADVISPDEARDKRGIAGPAPQRRALPAPTEETADA